jgi:hypothetical protein
MPPAADRGLLVEAHVHLLVLEGLLEGNLLGASKNRTGIIKSSEVFKESALNFVRPTGYLSTVQKSAIFGRSGLWLGL